MSDLENLAPGSFKLDTFLNTFGSENMHENKYNCFQYAQHGHGRAPTVSIDDTTARFSSLKTHYVYCIHLN